MQNLRKDGCGSGSQFQDAPGARGDGRVGINRLLGIGRLRWSRLRSCAHRLFLGAFLEGLGTPPEAVTLSMERNDSAALAAALAGSAQWSASPDKIEAPSLWYAGSDDNRGFTPQALDTASRLGVETHVISSADHIASFRRTNPCASWTRELSADVRWRLQEHLRRLRSTPVTVYVRPAVASEEIPARIRARSNSR